MAKNVEVNHERYKQLLEKELFHDALYAAGVKYWDNYSDIDFIISEWREHGVVDKELAYG
jgi:hypothetical protein